MIELFIKISIPFYAASLLAGLILLKKLDLPAKVLFFFLIIEIFVETYGYFLRKNHISNLWLYNIFIFLETIIFSGILISFLSLVIHRKVAIGALLTWMMLWLIYAVFKSILIFHPTVQVFQAVILIIFSGFILVTLSSSQQNLFQDSRFWFASAVFIFFITTIFVSAISSVITKPGYRGMENLWIINSIANIFSHILFIFYFIWNSRRRTLS